MSVRTPFKGYLLLSHVRAPPAYSSRFLLEKTILKKKEMKSRTSTVSDRANVYVSIEA